MPYPAEIEKLASRIISEQLDLAFGNQKPVAEALKSATQQINAEIEMNLKKSRELKVRYDAIRAGK